jgi:hypothetical protein
MSAWVGGWVGGWVGCVCFSRLQNRETPNPTTGHDHGHPIYQETTASAGTRLTLSVHCASCSASPLLPPAAPSVCPTPTHTHTPPPRASPPAARPPRPRGLWRSSWRQTGTPRSRTSRRGRSTWRTPPPAGSPPPPPPPPVFGGGGGGGGGGGVVVGGGGGGGGGGRMGERGGERRGERGKEGKQFIH